MFCQDQINHGKKIKIITPKEMLQRLPIVLDQVNTSQKLLNKTTEKPLNFRIVKNTSLKKYITYP